MQTGDAELPLLKAYFLAPESLNVLVALNRFYYYQHRLEDALHATGKALAVIRPLIGFPEDWRDLQQSHISDAPAGFINSGQIVFVYVESHRFFKHAFGESGCEPEHF